MLDHPLQSVLTPITNVTSVVSPLTSVSTPDQSLENDGTAVTRSRGHETKYLLLRTTSRDHLLARLRTSCKVDRCYPEAIVHSLYYDTRDWKLLGDKLDSNFIKLKVRLRWYSNAAADPCDSAGACNQAVFLEVKRRVGSCREKRRIRFPIPASELLHRRWDPELDRLVHSTLPALEMKTPRGLFPAIQVRYQRHRFVDPVTQARLSLDSKIFGTSGFPGRTCVGPRSPIDRVVLELKGPIPDLPFHLRPLANLGLRKTSFSKFAECANHLLQLKN